MLFEMAQRSAAIPHPRANQTVVGILLQRMRYPAGRSSNRENRRRNRARETEHAHANGEIEVEVGPRMSTHLVHALRTRRARDPTPQFRIRWRLNLAPTRAAARPSQHFSLPLPALHLPAGARERAEVG